MTFDEAIKKLAEEDSPKPNPAQSHDQELGDILNKLMVADERTSDLLEAIIDIGSILGLWTGDAIRISLENVLEHKQKYPELEGENLFAKRELALKRKLVAFVKSEGAKQQ